MHDVEQIVADVRSAFAWRPMPGDDEALATGFNSDARCVERDFRGKRCDELSFDVVFYNRAGLHDMTGAALMYYLPAFVAAGLSDHPGSGDIMTTLQSVLTPMPGYTRVHDRLRMFTPDEKRALEAVWRYDLELTRPDPSNAASLVSYEDEIRRMRMFWKID